MPSAVSRRSLFKAGAAGAAALTLTFPDASAEAATTAPFQHGVASGDPLGTAVVIWTRVTPQAGALPGSGRGGSVEVVWEVAADDGFRTLVRRGSVRTDSPRDHTVKVDVTGLSPYTRYWYRFRALGATSPVGRTQTAGDDGRVHALRMALVSCSNLTGGYFSAYRFIAQRDDLDLVLHLGDYLYEYGNGADRYGPESLKGKREHIPSTEIVTLADYRARHGCYKADVDLQAAHAAHPWIVIFDDHEVTNDTYDTGAENHQAAEGDFARRRGQAYQAYLEWMPIRLPDQRVPHRGTRFWRRFSFGPLADLSVIDTRQNRTQQVPGQAGALFGTEVQELADPARVLVEPEQMAWLKQGLAAKTASWHLVGNQTVFARCAVPRSLPGEQQLGPLGLGSTAFNTDQWDGYQDDQREVLTAMQAAGGDPVVLTGDIHSSWANELPIDPGTYPATPSVGVEFVCPSVTSDGFSEILGGDQPATAATTGLQATNPHIKYLDGIGHGYAVLDVTPERVQTDFWFVSDREDPRATQRFAAAWASQRGTRALAAAPGPVGARSDRPRTATAVAARPARANAVPTPASGTLPTTGGSSAAVAAAALLAGAVAARSASRSSD